MKCPECGKRHVKPPNKCYTIVINRYTHCCISKQASNNTCHANGICQLLCQQEQSRFDEMQEYIQQFK